MKQEIPTRLGSGLGTAVATAAVTGILIAIVCLSVLLALDWSLIGLLDGSRAVFIAGEGVAALVALALGGWVMLKVYRMERGGGR